VDELCPGLNGKLTSLLQTPELDFQGKGGRQERGREREESGWREGKGKGPYNILAKFMVMKEINCTLIDN